MPRVQKWDGDVPVVLVSTNHRGDTVIEVQDPLPLPEFGFKPEPGPDDEEAA